MTKAVPTFRDFIQAEHAERIRAARPEPKPVSRPRLTKTTRRGLAAIRAALEHEPVSIVSRTSEARAAARAMGGKPADVRAALDWIKDIQAWHGQPAPTLRDPPPDRTARRSGTSSAHQGSPTANGRKSFASTPERSTDGAPETASPSPSPAISSAPPPTSPPPSSPALEPSSANA